MAHDESAEDFLPQFAAPKSTSPTSSFRQALSQLQTSGLITSTIPSWRSQRQAPRPSASLFQVYQAQTLINHRRLNKALPVGPDKEFGNLTYSRGIIHALMSMRP
ncbi:hypothetical protein IWQ61_010457 [Dispira simplex]|nr:hypothetical protein IWQ61_010457 [Dispira simplex]